MLEVVTHGPLQGDARVYRRAKEKPRGEAGQALAQEERNTPSAYQIRTILQRAADELS